MNQHPFEQKLYSGKCNIHELRKWLINRYYFEETMLKKDCVIIENSTDHSFRKIWIKRIIDSQSPGGGLDQWIEMCESAGITDLSASPEAKKACDEYLEWCKNSHWKTVVAGSLSQIKAALNHTQKSLTWPDYYPGINWGYFFIRKDQAKEDSQKCLELINEWKLPIEEIEYSLKMKSKLMQDILYGIGIE